MITAASDDMVEGDADPIIEQIKGHGAWGGVCVCGRVCACIYPN